MLFAGHLHAIAAPEIQIRNHIKPKMLEYTFLKTGYCPDSFKLTVNGLEVKQDSSIAIPSNQKTMTVRYDYSFARGWRTGAKRNHLRA